MNILLYDALLIRINFVNIVCDIDTSTSGSRSWFDNPDILERTLLTESHEVGIEVRILIGEDVSFGENIKVAFPVELLHLKYVCC